MRSSRRGVRLAVGPERAAIPFPSLSILEVAAIHDAIVEAWRRLPQAAAQLGITLASAGEEPITRLLRNELNRIRRDERRPVPAFTEDAFQHVVEGEPVPDATGDVGNANTKRPDLVFRPVALPRSVPLGRDVEYGLFVECKILGRSHDHHALHDYCALGLRRFVLGDYAAAMASALMIAYVRDDRVVPAALTTYLSTPDNTRDYALLSGPTPRPHRWTPATDVSMSTSRHARDSVRVWHQHDCGAIELDHLWLRIG